MRWTTVFPFGFAYFLEPSFVLTILQQRPIMIFSPITFDNWPGHKIFMDKFLASADCDKCSLGHSLGCSQCCFYYSGPLSTKLLMQFLSNWDLRPSMEGSNELHHGFSFRFCVLFRAKEALS